MLFETSEMPGASCPYCGAQHNRASGVGQPSPGDASICIECTEVGVFDHQFSIRKPTEAEAREIAEDEVIGTYRKALISAKSKG